MRSFFIVVGVGLGIGALAFALVKLTEDSSPKGEATLGAVSIKQPDGTVTVVDGESGQVLSQGGSAPATTFELSDDMLVAGAATSGSS